MHPLRSMSALVVAAAALGVATGCSNPEGFSDPPPITRETIPESGVTTVPSESATGSGSAGSADGEATATIPPTTTELAEREYTIEWEDQGGGVEAGWLTVPLDYDDPFGETIDLWVVRHRSNRDDKVGALLVNNGGPGVGASSMAADPRSWFEDPLVEYFDVVAWDPRGTGISEGAVDCIDDAEYDRYYASSDITPDDEAERNALVDLAEDYATSCVERVGTDVLARIGTNNSARDMDAIRQALGEEQVSYFGYSYGSELGAVWATLFPDTVRAAVLDGAAHPDHEGLQPVIEQQLGFERVLNTFLAECSADSSCVFHNDGDAEGAYDALMASLDESPIPSVAGRPPVNREVAINGVIQAMYTDRRWPALERALDDAQEGDGAGLLALHDGYFRRNPDGSYGNLLEAFQAITCADDPDRLDPDEADAEAEELIGIAPRLFPYTTGSYLCGFFPPSDDPRLEITGERAGPIVVIGTTGDPSTPLDSSRAMADALADGRLVTVEANQHTAYRSGGCINDIVHQYLIWLEVPDPDVVCT